MDTTAPRSGSALQPVAATVSRLIRRVAATIAECHRAQQRFMALRLSTDRFLPDPDRAPDTYTEFLARTSGPAYPEPRHAAH